MRTLRDKGRIATRQAARARDLGERGGRRVRQRPLRQPRRGGQARAGRAGPRLERASSKRDAITKIGGDPDRIEAGAPRAGLVPRLPRAAHRAGRHLDKAGIPIGVVEGIVAIDRYEAVVRGFANHAGTTPMPERKDALVAASQLVLAVREIVTAEPGRQVGHRRPPAGRAQRAQRDPGGGAHDDRAARPAVGEDRPPGGDDQGARPRDRARTRTEIVDQPALASRRGAGDAGDPAGDRGRGRPARPAPHPPAQRRRPRRPDDGAPGTDGHDLRPERRRASATRRASCRASPIARAAPTCCCETVLSLSA